MSPIFCQRVTWTFLAYLYLMHVVPACPSLIWIATRTDLSYPLHSHMHIDYHFSLLHYIRHSIYPFYFHD
jgi:hypothetical protein